MLSRLCCSFYDSKCRNLRIVCKVGHFTEAHRNHIDILRSTVQKLWNSHKFKESSFDWISLRNAISLINWASGFQPWGIESWPILRNTECLLNIIWDPPTRRLQFAKKPSDWWRGQRGLIDGNSFGAENFSSKFDSEGHFFLSQHDISGFASSWKAASCLLSMKSVRKLRRS